MPPTQDGLRMVTLLLHAAAADLPLLAAGVSALSLATGHVRGCDFVPRLPLLSRRQGWKATSATDIWTLRC